MNERYISTVDLGTSKIALTIAKVTGENVQIIYYKERPSDGVRYSRIFNPMRAAAPLKAALAEAEHELGIKITQVVIGLPRFGVRQETSKAVMERTDSNSCITQEEIDAIKNIALDSYPLDDELKEEIYGASAQSFSTEDMFNCTEDDVVGQPSSSLEGNFKVFIGAKKAVSNIDIMLNNAGVAPARKYFLPDAIATAVLSREEKENGVALIEMGAGVTSVTIYEGSILRYYYSIPFGGKSITTDIKYECGFTERLAENIKLAYGACMPENLLTMSEKVLQIVDEEDGTDQQLTIKYLSEIITARVKEIIDAILFKVQESGYADRLRNGIVLTGGCANLVNCANLMKEMSGYNVRIGYPRARRFSSSGCPGIAETGAVASVGMLLLAKNDVHLNCTDDIPVIRTKVDKEEDEVEVKAAEKPEEPTTAPENTAAEKPEEGKTDGTVFDEKAWEKNKKKPEKKQRPERGYIRWIKKISGNISDRVGDLYESLEDNKE